KAEALLERKWPEKYNALGHLRWAGRLYGGGLTLPLGLYRRHIYQGTWGSALFQSIYEPAPNTLLMLTLMPEWYLVILALAVLPGVNSGKTPLQGSNPLKRTCAPWTSVCAAGAITTVGTWRYEAVYSGLHVHKWPLRSTVQANSSCVSARGRSVHQGDSCCCSSSLFFPPGLHSTEPGSRLSFSA